MRAGAREFRQFWADSREEEAGMWRGFLSFLHGLGECLLFHHGQYDAGFLRKMEKRHGGSVPEGAKLSNTLSFLYGRIYFPAYGNALMQLVGLGELRTFAEVRAIARAVPTRVYHPRPARHAAWQEAAQRFAEL